MDCQQIDRILDEHRLGGLNSEQAAALARHMGHCRRCADAKLAYDTLIADEVAAPRPGLFEDTMRRAGAKYDATPALPIRRAVWNRRVLGGGVAAAAALLIVLAGQVIVGSELVAESENSPVGLAAQPAAAESPRLLADAPATEIADFLAGRDYQRLPGATPTAVGADFIEVCEFFMFQCIHCFDFETELSAWNQRQSDQVELVRVPALFNGVARLHAQAWYTAEALGVEDEVLVPFYEEFHLRNNYLASEGEIREFFVSLGIDAVRFDETFHSEAVQAALERAEELNRLYRVSATPSIGVNGKFLTSPAMSGSTESMLEVVDALVESEAALLCSGPDRPACPLP